MKILKKEDDIVTLEISEEEYNLLRRIIGGFLANTPKQAWVTYSGFEPDEIRDVVKALTEEGDKFSIYY